MAVMRDKRGLEMTIADGRALAAHEALTDAYLGFRLETGDCLRAAMKADAEAPLIQTMAGYIFHLMAMRPLVERAEAASAKATALAAEVGNDRERLHAQALACWCAGDLRGAVNALEAVLIEWPEDALALKLAHYLHFYLGDIAEHRDSIARVMPAWREDMPGYAAVLGMRAFGLEEAGEYADAERFGRRAVELDPTDTWAIHAVAHVLEMQGRHREGISWIERDVAAWDGKIHNFANHVWWHKALYHLELGDTDAVLDLYDNRYRADDSEDGLDIANAAAMLMRLKLRGVDCGGRWTDLADVVAAKTSEHLLPFNDLHYMLALVGAEHAAVDEMAAGMVGGDDDGHWAGVYDDVAQPMARGLAAYGAGKYAEAVDCLAPVRYRWLAIGGSHAQRDIFQQVLIDAAQRAGQNKLARALLAERTAAKPNSADAWRRLAATANALDDEPLAATAKAGLTRLGAA